LLAFSVKKSLHLVLRRELVDTDRSDRLSLPLSVEWRGQAKLGMLARIDLRMGALGVAERCPATFESRRDKEVLQSAVGHNVVS